MSFMFNPLPYDDPTPVNKPLLSDSILRGIAAGASEAASVLCGEALGRAEASGSCIMAFDGYPGAGFDSILSRCAAVISDAGITLETVDVSSCYLAEREMEGLLAECLPQDRVKDPVLLYGKLFDGGYESIFDPDRLRLLIKRLRAIREGGGVVALYGRGSCCAALRALCDFAVYLDVTPKQAVLRAKEGGIVCVGDARPRPFKELMRRLYYADFELASRQRWELLRQDAVDFYVCDIPEHPILLTREALNGTLHALARVPFRCKPVYLKGVWGGHYVNRLRKLPEEIGAVAWVFDLIPLEVSILVAAGEHLLEFPFFTFVQKCGEEIMGADCVRRFKGYFPIRFNYDDTYHSGGNMSIQVHPAGEYCMREFNELGSQDESYYVIATGHGARTYCGLRETADAGRFLEEIRRSETEGTPVDHDRYVNSVPSQPGMQFMLPGGTVHASGRNQLILEIGSLTVGSYTFKLYDYLRSDLDGARRPIHSWHGAQVLDRSRREGWVRENLIKPSRLVSEGCGWAEYSAGETELMYFCTRRMEFIKEMPGDTAGAFHVLALVDGESVTVQSEEDPRKCFDMKYLDIVVIPASIGRYRLVNRGNQPAVMHKTLLRSQSEAGEDS